jgi:kanamycin kinase
MANKLPARFSDWEATVAWDYDGVVTVWRLRRGTERRFLKVRAIGRHHYSLADERDRLVWLRGRLSVPEVIDYGTDANTEWLLLSPLPGRDATDDELRADPSTLVPLLARGLHSFHERLRVTECPFDFRVGTALAHVRKRHGDGIFDDNYDWHEEFAHYSGAEAVARLEELRPADEDLVVCHGDYCFPNVLIENGQVVGYLDVGELGVADRWWDIAVGAWSSVWNLGPGFEELFYASYGVAPDDRRIEFYRLLYCLAS